MITSRVLIDRTHAVYDRLLASYCHLSVCLLPLCLWVVTPCTVAKRYILQQKRLSKWIQPLHRKPIFSTFNLTCRPYPLKRVIPKCRNFTYLLYRTLLITRPFCLGWCKLRKSFTDGPVNQSIAITVMTVVRSAIFQRQQPAAILVYYISVFRNSDRSLHMPIWNLKEERSNSWVIY